MSANDIDDLDPRVGPYVEAFARVERPSAATVARSWSAIEAATATMPVVGWRRPWVIATAVLAAAAAIALVTTRFVGQADVSQDPPQTQAPWSRPAAPPREAEPPAVRAAELPAAVPAAEVPIAPPRVDEPAPRARPVRRDRAPADEGGAVEPPPVDDSLAAETRLWATAQKELGGGRNDSALATIATWTKQFPTGRFTDERTLLKARALCNAGDRARARELRDTFIARHPTAPLAARMREVCVDAP